MTSAEPVEAPPQSVAAYIEDMLAELATMAEQIGERRLAAGMRLMAIEAARAVPAED